jgi:hypothetical protein
MKRNYLTEYVGRHELWKLDPKKYDWLTPDDINALSEYPFDYGDIMYAESCFTKKDAIPELLVCTKQDLDEYCTRLFRKRWDDVHLALACAYRNETISEVFRKHADEGNSTAMSIMANGVMRLNEEEDKKEMTIRIVSDLDDED